LKIASTDSTWAVFVDQCVVLCRGDATPSKRNSARISTAILLLGLLLNTFFNLWWADPVAAVIMVPITVREGIEGVQGKACDDCRCA
jgi:hypothetical protein